MYGTYDELKNWFEITMNIKEYDEKISTILLPLKEKPCFFTYKNFDEQMKDCKINQIKPLLYFQMSSDVTSEELQNFLEADSNENFKPEIMITALMKKVCLQ